MDQDELKNEEDFSLEENLEDQESATADFAVKFKKLKTELKGCQVERSEYLAGWQRAKADYLNLKKEMATTREQTLVWAKEGIFAELFALADSFELAFANQESWRQAPENWRLGVEYIYRQLQTIFRNHGIVEINPALGSQFDHHEAESVGTSPAAEPAEDEQVDEVFKKGYKMKERVLRPATVRVKHWSEN